MPFQYLHYSHSPVHQSNYHAALLCTTDTFIGLLSAKRNELVSFLFLDVFLASLITVSLKKKNTDMVIGN